MPASSRPPMQPKKKKIKLSAYEPHNMYSIETPRVQEARANGMPLMRPNWERTLPGVVPARANRKPLTIEDSLNLGYKKRLDMTGLQ